MNKVIKKESLSLETQIRFLLGDIKRLSNDLAKIEKNLDLPVEEKSRALFAKGISNTIRQYSATVYETKSKLEEYFIWEKKLGYPANFAFHSAYKKLNK